MDENYYQWLDVDADASEDEIRDALKCKVLELTELRKRIRLQYDPELESVIHNILGLIAKIKETLLAPEQRAAYDQTLAEEEARSAMAQDRYLVLCPYCGEILNAGASVCSSCGLPVLSPDNEIREAEQNPTDFTGNQPAVEASPEETFADSGTEPGLTSAERPSTAELTGDAGLQFPLEDQTHAQVAQENPPSWIEELASLEIHQEVVESAHEIEAITNQAEQAEGEIEPLDEMTSSAFLESLALKPTSFPTTGALDKREIHQVVSNPEERDETLFEDIEEEPALGEIEAQAPETEPPPFPIQSEVVDAEDQEETQTTPLPPEAREESNLSNWLDELPPLEIAEMPNWLDTLDEHISTQAASSAKPVELPAEPPVLAPRPDLMPAPAEPNKLPTPHDKPIRRYGRVEYHTPMDKEKEYPLRVGVLIDRHGKNLHEEARIHWTTLHIAAREAEPILRVVPSSVYFSISPPSREIKVKKQQDVFADFKLLAQRLPASPQNSSSLQIEFEYQGEIIQSLSVEVQVQDKFHLGPFQISHAQWKNVGMVAGGLAAFDTITSLLDFIHPFQSAAASILFIFSLLFSLLLFGLSYFLWKKAGKRVFKVF